MDEMIIETRQYVQKVVVSGWRMNMLFHIQRVEYGGESFIGGVRVVAMATKIATDNDSLA